MASVDAKTGARKRWKINAVVRNYGTAAATMSLAADKTTDLRIRIRVRTGQLRGHVCGLPDRTAPSSGCRTATGTPTSVAPIGGVVYAVGHAHFCSNIGGFPDTPTRIGHRALAMTQQAVGTVAANTQPGAHYGNFGGQPAPALFNWFPDLAQGSFTGASQAAWSITGNSTYISLGGEFPAVNGVPQQGLVRFAIPSKAPNASGPKLTGSAIAPTVALNAQGTVAVSWLTNHDFDDRKLQYEVLRDGAVVNTVKVIAYFWNRLPVAYTDSGVSPGPTYSYQIRTTDPDGNAVLSPAVQVTTPALAAAQQQAAEQKVGDAPLATYGATPATKARTQSRELYLDGKGKLVFAIRPDDGDLAKPVIVQTGRSVADGRWHHVVAVHAANGVRLYLDGKLAGTSRTSPVVTRPGQWWTVDGAPWDPMARTARPRSSLRSTAR